MPEKTVQVFENPPGDLWDDLSDNYEADNGSYHRWYPVKPNYVSEELFNKTNAWLKSKGMKIPEDAGEYFYVLIRFSW